MTKTCSKCKEVKTVAEYYKANKNKSGINSQCKACILLYTRKYRLKNKEQTRETCKKYKEKNRKKINARRMEYYYANKEKVVEQKKKYYNSNKKEVIKRVCAYHKNKLKTNPTYKLIHNLRRRAHLAIKGNYKADTTKAMLGCTYEEARAHIEAQFTEGMSWDKMGRYGIHIDHIRPCASFDLTDPEQQRECFHYTNLQPLWAEDNLRKSDRW